MNKQTGRGLSRGVAEGELLVTTDDLSFLGGVNPETGVIVERGHDAEGRCVAGKVLAFPRGKGSTVGSYVVYQLKKNGVAPAAILNRESETIVAVGAIISDLPLVDEVDLSELEDGATVRVDGKTGTVETV